ncbi:hypothetical protein [Amycolatopsis sp. NPDC006125]|uniref:hypothetical protein n=1 Tax=Amycolatopsis sp. NPDC006125 TaxID=3156730 RepID=UPI0033A366FD
MPEIDPDRDLEVALDSARIARVLPNGAAETARAIGWEPRRAFVQHLVSGAVGVVLVQHSPTEWTADFGAGPSRCAAPDCEPWEPAEVPAP